LYRGLSTRDYIEAGANPKATVQVSYKATKEGIGAGTDVEEEGAME
jgi:hypothetical protein